MPTSFDIIRRQMLETMKTDRRIAGTGLRYFPYCSYPVILVVDESEFVRGCLRTILDQAGFVSCEASNGEQCIEMVAAADRQGRSTIVIIDPELGEITGSQTLEVMKEMYRDGRISRFPTVVSHCASPRAAQEDTSTHTGMKAFLRKPESARRIQQCISTLLRSLI